MSARMHSPESMQVGAESYGLALAVWGGLVHFMGRDHRGKGAIRLASIFFCDLATAGFVAKLTWHLSMYAGLTVDMAVVLCGISGHMGSRALALFERVYTRWLGARGE